MINSTTTDLLPIKYVYKCKSNEKMILLQYTHTCTEINLLTFKNIFSLTSYKEYVVTIMI